MSESNQNVTEDEEVEQHPAARHADQLAWAVFVETDSNNDSELFAVTGNSEQVARTRALNRCEGDGKVVHVDGPFENSEPGVWEFTYYTEHRETIVVEGPHPDYAEETADVERDYRGELIQTTHTEKRRLDIDPNEEVSGDV